MYVCMYALSLIYAHEIRVLEIFLNYSQRHCLSFW